MSARSPYDTGVRVREFIVTDPASQRELTSLVATVAPQQIGTGLRPAEGAQVLHVYRGADATYVVPVTLDPKVKPEAWSVEGAPTLTAIRDEYLFTLEDGGGEQ